MSKLLADIRAYMNHRLADAGFEHVAELAEYLHRLYPCLLYTSPSPRDS